MERLIISPHLDDEVLGCASMLEGWSVRVIYCGIDETTIKDLWVRERPNIAVRRKEQQDVQRFLNFQSEILNHPVNQYELSPLVSSIEEVITRAKPSEVLIPHPSYNQDHKTVYDASLIALRPHDLNHFVKRVLVYEQPHVYLWGHSGNDFKPNYFKQLDVEKKITAYNLYQSQVRDFRGESQIRALAAIRGAQANIRYAEGFQVLRWVE